MSKKMKIAEHMIVDWGGDGGIMVGKKRENGGFGYG